MRSCIYFILIVSTSWMLYMCNFKPNFSISASNGKIIHLGSFQSKWVEPRPIDIWIPSDYDTAKSYAVVYMQDGQMLFDSTMTWTHQEWKADETLSKLMQQKSVEDAIIVGIHNAGINRWAEYVPQVILDSLPEEVRTAVVHQWLNDESKSDVYLRFIVEELKPYVDQHYSTKPDRDHTIIMGSSMGGIISLYAICRYPEVFGGAGCMSTHWPLNVPGMTDDDPDFDVPSFFINYLDQHLPVPDGHRIYFDLGTETLDRLYPPYQQKVDAIMEAHGYTSSNWVTRTFPDEEHSERSWAKRLDVPFQFLLGLN